MPSLNMILYRNEYRHHSSLKAVKRGSVQVGITYGKGVLYTCKGKQVMV